MYVYLIKNDMQRPLLQTGLADRWSCYIDHHELTDDEDSGDGFTLNADLAKQRRNKKEKLWVFLYLFTRKPDVAPW